MQQAMGFAGGTDVATIFKGLQLECGFTHQYFDAHFEVLSADRGRFWLHSCGALLETEPRGDDAVRVMCHDIEDPTFNATAVATNARARMVPVHRPPRIPADRVPHCEWTVTIEHNADPVAEPAIAQAMSALRLAGVPVVRPAGVEAGGMDYYSGAVVEQLHLEQLSHAALVVVCGELAVQVHLLVTALMQCVAERYGEEAALAVGEFQMAGSSWVVSQRLRQWLQTSATGIDAVIAVLQVHPAFQPSTYWSLDIVRVDEQRAVLRLLDCPACQEEVPYGWHALLRRGLYRGLEGLVQGVDPRARIIPVAMGELAWEIVVAPDAAPAETPLSVQVASSTVLYQTQLQDHIPLLQL
jgi:hypothetical protein